jgi:hypothetical protein
MSTMDQMPDGVEWLHEGTEEEIDFDGAHAQVQFYVPDNVREEFLRVVGGLPEQFSIGTTSYTRIVPLRYPRFDNCYATGVRMRGEGRSGPPADGSLGIVYDYWVATVRFATPLYRFDGSYPAVTESGDSGADVITRPGTAYKFPSDNLIVPHPVGVLAPTIDFLLTFHQVPSFNGDLYVSLSGRVNTHVFYNRAIGTVQYIGLSWNGQKTTGNVVSWDITHKFRFRWIEHNKIMRPDGTAFEAPVQVGGAGTNYLLPTADLNALWTG